MGKSIVALSSCRVSFSHFNKSPCYSFTAPIGLRRENENKEFVRFSTHQIRKTSSELRQRSYDGFLVGFVRVDIGEGRDADRSDQDERRESTHRKLNHRGNYW
jgi:hypothetical protein